MLLCGYLPFVGETNAEVLRAVAGGEGALEFDEADWANLSQAARDFVRHALAHDERARPAASELLAHACFAGGAHGPAVRPPPPRDVSAAWGAYRETDASAGWGPCREADRAARPPRASDKLVFFATVQERLRAYLHRRKLRTAGHAVRAVHRLRVSAGQAPTAPDIVVQSL